MCLIKDFRNSPVLSVDSQTFFKEATKLMYAKKVSLLLVKEGEEYVGMVTKIYFVKKLVAEDGDPKTKNYGSVMSKPLFSLDEYTQRSEANEFILRKKIKHLAVTSGKHVVQILTIKEIVA
jgi:signal-transduction protein with cAMP-binding, CBS, and nucleotidyltransferase domain